MKYIVFVFSCFFQFVYAANVTEPVIANSLVNFYFEGNLSTSGTGIKVPTHSNYFSFHEGRIFMTHVEKSNERLREISFVDNKFVVSNVEKNLPFQMKFDRALVNEVNKELFYTKNIYNCPMGTVYDRGRRIITIPGVAAIHYLEVDLNEYLENEQSKSTFAIQFLKCTDDYIVIASLKCISSGYCEQQIHGTKRVKTSDFTPPSLFDFLFDETVTSDIRMVVPFKIKELHKPLYINNNFQLAEKDAYRLCPEVDIPQDDKHARALSNLGWKIKQSFKADNFQVVQVYSSSYLAMDADFCHYGNVYSFIFKDDNVVSMVIERGVGFFAVPDTAVGDMVKLLRVFEKEHIRYLEIGSDIHVCPEKSNIPSLYRSSFEEAANALNRRGGFTREFASADNIPPPGHCEQKNNYCSYIFKNEQGTRVRLNTKGIGEEIILENTDILCKDVEM
jgi:hypothetical protein